MLQSINTHNKSTSMFVMKRGHRATAAGEPADCSSAVCKLSEDVSAAAPNNLGELHEVFLLKQDLCKFGVGATRIDWSNFAQFAQCSTRGGGATDVGWPGTVGPS